MVLSTIGLKLRRAFWNAPWLGVAKCPLPLPQLTDTVGAMLAAVAAVAVNVPHRQLSRSAVGLLRSLLDLTKRLELPLADVAASTLTLRAVLGLLTALVGQSGMLALLILAYLLHSKMRHTCLYSHRIAPFANVGEAAGGAGEAV